jgi:hypothetical protein
MAMAMEILANPELQLEAALQLDFPLLRLRRGHEVKKLTYHHLCL